MSSADQEGYAAAMAGMSVATNPYVYTDDDAAVAWMRGYQRGEREEAEQHGHFRDTS